MEAAVVAAVVAEVAGAKEGMAAAVAREGMVSKETASLACLIIIVEVLGALEHLGAEILRTTGVEKEETAGMEPGEVPEGEPLRSNVMDR